MRNADNLYSQFIGWSKILLPLTALALLSTLFLLARAPGEQSAVPVAEISEIAQEQRISKPAFSGIADDGSVIHVSANTAKPTPDNPNSITIDNLKITADATDGSNLEITALNGAFDNDTRTVTMDGLARLTTSTGYSMETNGLIADMNSGEINSIGPLEIRAPFGHLTAGHVTIKTSTDDTGQQMLFTQGVRLLYQPDTPLSQD